MNYKSLYAIAVTIFYIGIMVKLVSIVINKHKTPSNLLVEFIILLCCIGAYWVTMYGIKHGTLTPEK